MSSEQVRRYFDREAERFDTIYREEKKLSQKLVDHLFRDVIHRRFRLTFELCGEVSGKRILDIGCGSGRFAVEFARLGAEVVGIDFAPGMLEMAREAAKAAEVSDRCRFVNGDFLKWCEPDHFDICLAIGFFDYIEQPGVFLEKINRMRAEQVVFSFPVRWTLRSLSRWMRLNLNRCPVYFYNAKESVELLVDAGWKSVEIHRLSRDYLVCGRLD